MNKDNLPKQSRLKNNDEFNSKQPNFNSDSSTGWEKNELYIENEEDMTKNRWFWVIFWRYIQKTQ